MVVKSSVGSWKKLQLKKKWRMYTTANRLSKIVSTNKIITHHINRGQIDFARQLFDEMRERTVVSWNTMISGYSISKRLDDALHTVSLMHRSTFKLNETTISSVLSICARSQSIREGKQIHGLLLRSGFERFKFVGSGLLFLYANCFKIEEACRVFDSLHEENELLWNLMLVGYVHCNLMSDAFNLFARMPTHNVVSWTTLISGYSKSHDDDCYKALQFFRLMTVTGEVLPNEFTFHSVLTTCGKIGALLVGRTVHGSIVKFGLENDSSIGDALIDLYCNCESIDHAKRVYDEIINPSSTAANRLIDGLISIGWTEVAEMLFNRMINRDSVTYNLMIKAYALSGRINESKKVFDEMPERTIASSNTMISVYSRNGELNKALKLFEETKHERNQVTWNGMISGYVHNELYEEAQQLYLSMMRFGVRPTRSTFSVLLHTCSVLGVIQLGQLLHGYVIKTSLESNVFVGTAIVDMYSKCGSISDAERSFFSIYSPNVAAWTALINGYAHHGLSKQARLHFNLMLKQGVRPNGATFVGILTACGRAGLVEEGMMYFDSMKQVYEVIPGIEHYTCVVDLLGRSGNLEAAERIIRQMPMEPDNVVLGALLNGCWFWMDMEMGERVAEEMIRLDRKSVFAYVILSNIYAGLGKWEAKTKLRKSLRKMEMKKEIGCSWIEVNHGVHMFLVQDSSHPNRNMIFTTLDHLMANVSPEI
ncbi:putative pentatricopeptide repeat-containing protein At5g59200, chloroplastic isoform X1 [Impatiens glandulifera]|uniref:putative pentatricopeptide repeat-containing protein At5g59200, chloroplastic isoform X1 n=1 Tax=Impatiens glandulifera TaxID=253017 RepID=UPI001FB04BE3|nr:putative pentatricopeptide repeat-containing protein At5g59200, chloroplastic isoform X1 [Impatiens glandulifera]